MRVCIHKWVVVGFVVCVFGFPSYCAAADPDPTDIGAYLDQFKESLKIADDFLAQWTAISDAEEMAIGKDIANRINAGNKLITGEIQKRVERLGQRLTQFSTRKGISYTFHVLDADMINAYAISGGNIWVTRGMIDFVDNDDQLAGVLGHEIAHVDLRHCIRAIQYQLWALKLSPDHLDYVRIGHSLINKSYSQLNELESDRTGVQFMFQGNYDPNQMVAFMNKMEELEKSAGAYTEPKKTDQLSQVIYEVNDFLRSHPLSRERKEKLQLYIEEHLRAGN
jgi:predicted Zn-dependent protease